MNKSKTSLKRLEKFVKHSRCICGHLSLMHGGYGCEGIYTGLDTGQPGPQPCWCQEFKAMQEVGK